MKDGISVIVQVVPILIVMWLLGRRHGHQKKKALRDAGPALAASGICTFIGAKFFGLSVFGKTTVSRGEDAVGASLFLIAFGAVLFGLHYFLFGLVPALWRVCTHEKKRG